MYCKNFPATVWYHLTLFGLQCNSPLKTILVCKLKWWETQNFETEKQDKLKMRRMSPKRKLLDTALGMTSNEKSLMKKCQSNNIYNWYRYTEDW